MSLMKIANFFVRKIYQKQDRPLFLKIQPLDDKKSMPTKSSIASNLLVAGIAALSSVTAFAQSSIVTKIPGVNQIVKVQVPANTAATTPVVFYYVSKGNLSSQIGVQLQGPKGLEASVEAAQIKGAVQTALDNGKFWKIYLTGSLVGADKKAAARLAQTAIPQSSAATANPMCTMLPDGVIKAILVSLSTDAGREITREEYCSGTYQPPDSNSAPNPGSSDEGIDLPAGTDTPSADQPKIDLQFGTAQGVLQKDNCGSIKNYLVKITIKLNKVAAADLAQGFEVATRLQEVEWDGPRVASMKPVSDGKYAPRPLLLMQSLGGKQWVNLVQWAKGTPKTVVKVAATPSLAFHRGYVLIRIVADKLLAGGRGEKVNFELANGYNLYNVCGKRARVRWRINGYPS